MYFDTLPTEILTQVFLHLPDINSVISLSATCHRCHGVFHSSKKLSILEAAADAEYGPIDEIIQLQTQNASQPAHHRRSVAVSEALLHQIVKVGRVAQRYEEIYPFKKWKNDYANRRLLTDAERFVLRRAVYRLWLFDKAFHNAAHVRTCRSVPEVLRERAALLHNFSTVELAEMLDVHLVLHDLVANNICPSNGKIRQKFHKRFPDGTAVGGANQLVFLNQPFSPLVPSLFAPSDGWYHNSSSLTFPRHQNHCSFYQQQSRLLPSRWHEPGAEGWGDEISHYYVVEDMLKLDPAQLIYLHDQCPLKAQVEAVVRELGDWFINNGQTFSETMEFVMRQRCMDMQEIRAAIEEGVAGVAVSEEE